MASGNDPAGSSPEPGNPNGGPPVPSTFFEYLRSFGPGLIIVLTWLGAGDVVQAAVSGGSYGYALMWVMVLAIGMRFVFVSLIAKFQLCNDRGEAVLDGLGRLSPLYPPFLAVMAVVMGHVYNSYMTVGIGESWSNVFGTKELVFGTWGTLESGKPRELVFVLGQPWQWAIVWNGIALAIVFRPVYARIERVFLFLLALLSVSFLGTAIWIGPNPSGIVRGIFTFSLPEKTGSFDSVLVAMAMIGAVGGSMMNLVYPYFLEQKGWKGPRYRRLQLYDFGLGIIVMIILNLSVWTLGAELLYPQHLTVETTDDLPRLLIGVLGPAGRLLFYGGIFAAVYTSLVGHSLGLACMASHGFQRWQQGTGAKLGNYRDGRIYHWVVVWCLVSPLIWTAPGMPSFVTLTLVANSAQVVLVPILAIGLWVITARSRYIGRAYRNRWWENAVMCLFLLLALWATWQSIHSFIRQLATMMEP